jgi:hypothetical protein
LKPDSIGYNNYFMKKYLFGMLAIVFAVGLVSFTTPQKAVFTEYFFAYNGPGTFTEAQVEDPTGWILASGIGDTGLPPACSGSNVKACRIKVDESVTFVDAFGVRKLRFGSDPNKADIVAAAHASGTYYVTLAADVLQVNNKD